MHSYLKSIGFSDLADKKDLDCILEDVIHNCDEKVVAQDRKNHLFTEISKMYGCGFGITVCGEYDEKDQFQMEYYFPFFRGTGITMQEELTIEKHGGRDSFAGACDDMRVGVTIIFYLQNAGKYLLHRSRGSYQNHLSCITLSGLAKKGTVLLPVMKMPEADKKDRENMVNRNRLIAAAKNGDEEAIESLTIEDMDTYSMISKRILNEDIYSIVESSFMPYGMECDLYQIVGEILECTAMENNLTKDRLYALRISCNDLELDICINENDLTGEPEAGRRFKGIVWLQGNVEFE